MIKEWTDKNGNVHIGSCLASKNGYDAIECTICQFTHIIPIPSDKELDEYYKNIFYTDYKPDYINNHRKEIKWWNSIYSKRKYLFNKHSKIDKNKKPRLLDIGSGPGFFLKYFSDLGWDVIGIEPSSSAAKFSREMGLTIYEDSIYDFDLPSLGQFDIIHSNQTFEHLSNPLKLLEDLKCLMHSKSLLFICVANDFNPIQKILNKKMGYPNWWFIPPEHINYFNTDSLRAIVKQTGFEVCHYSSTFPIDLFLLMNDDYINNDAIGKMSHERRKNLEFNLYNNDELEFQQKLYNAFNNINIGRELEIILKK